MDMVYSKICDMFSAYVLVKIEMEEEEDGGVIVPRYIISKRRGIKLYTYMLVHL